MDGVSNLRAAGVVGPAAALSDEEVVARVLAGDLPLFEVLMRRHNQRLYRTARAIVRDDAEAEDVMQETYVRAYAALGQFEGRAQWATWLTRIAVNEALARVRARGRFVSREATEVMEDDVMAKEPPLPARSEGPEAAVSAVDSSCTSRSTNTAR